MGGGVDFLVKYREGDCSWLRLTPNLTEGGGAPREGRRGGQE